MTIIIQDERIIISKNNPFTIKGISGGDIRIDALEFHSIKSEFDIFLIDITWLIGVRNNTGSAQQSERFLGYFKDGKPFFDSDQFLKEYKDFGGIEMTKAGSRRDWEILCFISEQKERL